MQSSPTLAGSGLLLLLIIAIITISGCLKTGESNTLLRIETIDIAAAHVKSSYVDFNITTYLENYGKIASKNASLLLKAYNSQNNLLEKQMKTSVGSIDAGKTVGILQSLTLPRKGGYNIQMNLYEGEVEKASQSVSISNLESLQEDVKNIGIEIDEMDFLIRNASDRKVVIENDIYFSNEGSDNSSEFDVLVKARERDAQLIADKKWIHLGAIKPETTVVRSVNLTVPDQYNYIIEATIWSKDTIVKRGEGVVSLKPGINLTKGERVESRSIDTGEFKTAANATAAAPAEVKAPKAPGFEILIAVVAIIVAATMGRRRYGR